MMEDGEEEENDDNYRQMFPEYGDTAMEEEEGDEWASVEPTDDLSRVISDVKLDCVTKKRRGCSSSRCYRATKNCYTQIVKMARRSWVAH
jgi:hypothetical protein